MQAPTKEIVPIPIIPPPVFVQFQAVVTTLSLARQSLPDSLYSFTLLNRHLNTKEPLFYKNLIFISILDKIQ